MKNKKSGKPTLKDIAKKSGVNVSTVSRVLNNTATISDKVKKKIQKISKELGYTPNTIARALVTRKSNAIGLVVPNFVYMSGSFFQETMIGIETEVNHRHYNIVLTKLKGEERHSFTHTVRSGMLDGAIVLGDVLVESDLEELASYNIPMVILNSAISGKQIPYVAIDNVHGGKIATQHLIENGFKRLIYLGGGDKEQVTIERREGFLAALAEAGLKSNPKDIMYVPFATALKSAYEIMSSIDLTADRTGIFAASDNIAYGVMKYCHDQGLEIGKKIGIVGYDNVETNDFMKIPLTSVDQKGRVLGEAACKMLLDLIENRTVAPSFKIKPVLVARKSCGES